MQHSGSETLSPQGTSQEETLTRGPSPTSPPMTCAGTTNVTSLQGSPVGLSPSSWPDGTTLDLFGQEVAPASRSPRLGRRSDSQTSGICGLFSEPLSPSADLQSSLENRLRERLATNGCPAFALTWRAIPMLSGPPICALLASENGTAASDCIGLPSPITKYDGRSMAAWRIAKARAKNRHSLGLYGKGTGAPGMVDLQRRLRLLLGCDNGKVTTAFVASMMGYPETWLSTAPSATPSSRRLRPRSSKA